MAPVRKVRSILTLFPIVTANCSSGEKAEPLAARTIAANSQTNLSQYVGLNISPPPSVIVRDQNGNPFAGAPVTFNITAGGGTIFGASQVTDSSGVATVGAWTLGLTPGPNVLTATSGSLSFSFTANGVSKCELHRGFQPGSVGGFLETNDCSLPNGRFVDYFEIELPAADAYLFSENTTLFNTYLYLSFADGTAVAENDDQSGTTTNSAIKATLPAGTYLLGTSSALPSITGAYSLQAASTSPNNTGCELIFVARNVSTSQNIASTDCLWNQPPASPIYADKFQIFLKAGQSATISMTSASIDSYLEILNATGNLLAQDDNRDATTTDAQITFTAATASYYTIVARAAGSSQGQYSLAIQ